MKKGTIMLTLQHYLRAARDLLVGDVAAPMLNFSGGPLLDEQQLQPLCAFVRESQQELVYLHFGADLDDGPLTFQSIVPRRNVIVICPAGELWAPLGNGRCALVGADDHSGYQAFSGGELAFHKGSRATDLRPGIQRARKRLIARARRVSIDGSERNGHAILRA